MIKPKRIESVDVLRGFAIIAMILVNTPGDWNHVYAPLLHADWHGLTPTDLIFPFFLFIVGISIYFAYKNKKPSNLIYKKIGIRSLKLIGLGLFLNLFSVDFPFVVDLDSARLPGVLQRIGIVFFITSILYLHCNWKVLVGIGVTILVGYWLFLGFMPFPNPDNIISTFDRGPNNWANYIDSKILGLHMWQTDYDPEGIVSTFPALVTCIIGVLIGRLLDAMSHVRMLFVTAFGLLASGYIFDIVFPINKAIWSSSFVLATAGWGTLLLAIIYYLKDVKKIVFGTIFKYVGVNAITIYFLSSFISKSMYSIKVSKDDNLHSWIYDTLFVNELISLKFSSLLYALCVVVFYVGLAYVMFKRNIFVKV